VSAHPDVKYIFEAHPIWELAALGENDSHRLSNVQATAPIIKAVREWFENQQGPSLTVEKNPRNTLRVPYITSIFPEAKIIHIVRDGRDVACSLLPGIGSAEWMHLKPPNWKALLVEEPITRCAMVWRDIMEIALADLSSIPHLMVKYEDMVLAPENVAKTILNYLGLSWDFRVQEFCRHIQNSTRNSYHAQYSTAWYRDNHSIRVGRWKENLDATQQELIQDILRNTLGKLGYLDETVRT
jgi:hypothetical protein